MPENLKIDNYGVEQNLFLDGMFDHCFSFWAGQ